MATLTHWRPFTDFADMHDRLDRLIGEASGTRAPALPAIDMIRGDDQIIIKADMPGLSPADIKIRAENGILTISGEHEEVSATKEDRYMRRERSYGSFSRSLTLPAGIDPDAIEATSKDGVMQVAIPLPKRQQKKSVEITPTPES